MFRSRLIGQHLSDALHDLATLTFDLGGHYACCWCGSSCSICIPSLNFVGLTVRKILHIYCASISRPGDLDLWPLTLKLMHIIARRVDNHPTNFGVAKMFRSQLIGQHLSDALHDLATLTFDLGGHRACCRCGSSCSVCVPSLKFLFGRYCALPVSALVGLATLTFVSFDLETGVHYCLWGGQHSHQFWCFYDVSFSTYRPKPVGRVTWPCDLDLWSWRSWRLSLMRLRTPSVYQVWTS